MSSASVSRVRPSMNCSSVRNSGCVPGTTSSPSEDASPRLRKFPDTVQQFLDVLVSAEGLPASCRRIVPRMSPKLTRADWPVHNPWFHTGRVRSDHGHPIDAVQRTGIESAGIRGRFDERSVTGIGVLFRCTRDLLNGCLAYPRASWASFRR